MLSHCTQALPEAERKAQALLLDKPGQEALDRAMALKVIALLVSFLSSFFEAPAVYWGRRILESG